MSPEELQPLPTIHIDGGGQPRIIRELPQEPLEVVVLAVTAQERFAASRPASEPKLGKSRIMILDTLEIFKKPNPWGFDPYRIPIIIDKSHITPAGSTDKDTLWQVSPTIDAGALRGRYENYLENLDNNRHPPRSP